MGKLHLAVICVGLLHSPLYAQHTKEMKGEPPTKAEILAAIDLAEQSLKHYQLTLGKLNAMPEVSATIQKDSEPIVVGGMAVILLRTKLSQEQSVDPLELAILFANVDAAAINAALTVGTLAIDADPSNNKLTAAKALLGSIQEFKASSDRLWKILEAYLSSQKAWIVRDTAR